MCIFSVIGTWYLCRKKHSRIIDYVVSTDTIRYRPVEQLILLLTLYNFIRFVRVLLQLLTAKFISILSLSLSDDTGAKGYTWKIDTSFRGHTLHIAVVSQKPCLSFCFVYFIFTWKRTAATSTISHVIYPVPFCGFQHFSSIPVSTINTHTNLATTIIFDVQTTWSERVRGYTICYNTFYPLLLNRLRNNFIPYNDGKI